MTRPIRGLWLFLLSALGLHGGTAAAASIAVLCNSDIPGDSQVKGAEGCIDVLAWSWGLSSQSSAGPKGPALSVPTFQDFKFTKAIDSSSDDLFRFAALHKAPLTGNVEFREYQTCGTGCAPGTPYLTIHLRPAQVTSMSMANSNGGDLDIENISLVFAQVSYCYQSSDKGSPQCVAYDLTTNTSIAPF